MTLEEIVAKQWEEATIQDNFIFSKTMELYPDICKKLIELILKIKVKNFNIVAIFCVIVYNGTAFVDKIM